MPTLKKRPMQLEQLFKHISVNPKICHGKPCIKGTRIMVWQILDLLSAGIAPEQITSPDYYPDLKLEDIQASLVFANQMVKNEEIHFFEEISK
ncbi:DUF433 domain-containing protein [Candidatus Margulisiibacteriota bacterium]